MSKRILIAAATIAASLVATVVSIYVAKFGTTPANSQGLWGQFGDYFGGLLNPLFAMLAFLALLWSITLQKREFAEAAKHLSIQSDVARQQLDVVRDDQIAQALLHVIKDIDARLEEILGATVSTPGTHPTVTIAHMVSEAERVATAGVSSASFTSFVTLAQSSGSVVEASVREIIELVAQMRQFLEEYSQFRSGRYAPVIVYYASKAYRL